MHQINLRNPGELRGISARTIDIHYGKLYAGYVAKRNEIEESIGKIKPYELEFANQTYSKLRGLKEGETFAANGMILHQIYFSILGNGGKPSGELFKSILKQWGSWESFYNEMVAVGLTARGWAVLAYDFSDNRLHIFQADAQNQGGVWGAIPLIALDVYEHAYFIDHGSNRKAYIEAFFENLNWEAIDKRYTPIKAMVFK